MGGPFIGTIMFYMSEHKTAKSKIVLTAEGVPEGTTVIWVRCVGFNRHGEIYEEFAKGNKVVVQKKKLTCKIRASIKMKAA